MTWYAQQVIADAVPGLLAELRIHPVFARGLYHVKDLESRRRVLSLALLHHGLAIQRHFVPHENDFPWEQHRIAPG